MSDSDSDNEQAVHSKQHDQKNQTCQKKRSSRRKVPLQSPRKKHAVQGNSSSDEIDESDGLWSSEAEFSGMPGTFSCSEYHSTSQSPALNLTDHLSPSEAENSSPHTQSNLRMSEAQNDEYHSNSWSAVNQPAEYHSASQSLAVNQTDQVSRCSAALPHAESTLGQSQAEPLEQHSTSRSSEYLFLS
ncbi:Chromodomain-helicase-DNA-binding protein 9 [Frankliniella fusca]|uniref:Chromodomain-helicase-DNA-binding protein 9 n=1 Tax=Frankliniella fusca TaxID=407009 RepID=A0AAE1HCQ4_9NEOP|nr:Chromodomain-helicase-DNA-binding protein 9 [Frankliniella fusca]